ncbi:MAG: gamma-glutamyltransferase [Pseudomonadales bacterium]|nr:gamma-glutamyltransferase [Pseudomonadales bacterium]
MYTQTPRAARFVRAGIIGAALFSALTSCSISPTQREDRDPEAATGLSQKTEASSQQFMVSAANPYAAKAGSKILSKGGNAIDAAIAVQLVLNLVEPQSSGIGGGAFLLYWDQSKRELVTFDGRETAPGQADSNLFHQPNGEPMKWIEAVVGGKSVGVPGVLKMFEKAHQRYGTLPWATLFEDAIQLAEKGFTVSPRLEKLVAAGINPGLKRSGATRQYFFPNEQPIKAGKKLKNPMFADALRRIAEEGSAAFYGGSIAQNIVDKVNNDLDNPGQLTLEDLSSYEAKIRPPVCAPYRSYKICGMGPPSSGGLTVIQTMQILSYFDLPAMQPLSTESIHIITQAQRLAFADRNTYIADSDFVSVPVRAMLDPLYAKNRAQLINLDQDMGKAKPGHPAGVMSRSTARSPELPSTSHFSIVDKQGNGVSVTTSIEMAFGSSLMVDGFLLNNQLTDFSFAAEANGTSVANKVEPGKRPRSSMAPTMVFDKNGELVLLIGSPGGSRIINYVIETLVALLDWDLSIQDAINLPHFGNRNGATDLEKGSDLEGKKAALEMMNHTVNIRDLNSGLHGIKIGPEGNLTGGADPRREGLATGQ